MDGPHAFASLAPRVAGDLSAHAGGLALEIREIDMKYCEHCGERDCHCVVRPISRRTGPAVRGPRLVVSNAASCAVGHHTGARPTFPDSVIATLRRLGVQLREAE